MTEIFDVSVAGAAATELDSGSFTAIDEGVLHILRIKCVGQGTGLGLIYVNEDQTDNNYRRDFWRSDTTHGSFLRTNDPAFTYATDRTYAEFYVLKVNDVVFFFGQGGRLTTNRAWFVGGWNNVETTLSRIELVSVTASQLGVGTRMQLLRVDDADAEGTYEVSGAAATDLSSGALTGYATGGDMFLVAAGVRHTAGATSTSLYFAGNTTDANYDSGSNNSDGGGEGAFPLNMISDANEESAAVGLVQVLPNSGGIAATFMAMRKRASASNFRAFAMGTRITDTDLDEIELNCNTASGLDVGSFLKFWKLNN